jgi:DNA-binding MarR family transcriptional regulator
MMSPKDPKTIDAIIENLFYIFPVFHKKLLKVDLRSVHDKIKLTRFHLVIMWMIKKERLPASELAKRFLILKPQMTRLIKELANAGLVKKQPDINDRRVTYISLTPSGEGILKQCRKLIKSKIKRRLTCLDEREIEELSLFFAKMRDIASKLENSGG